jgi:hypothetical protein
MSKRNELHPRPDLGFTVGGRGNHQQNGSDLGYTVAQTSYPEFAP